MNTQEAEGALRGLGEILRAQSRVIRSRFVHDYVLCEGTSTNQRFREGQSVMRAEVAARRQAEEENPFIKMPEILQLLSGEKFDPAEAVIGQTYYGADIYALVGQDRNLLVVPIRLNMLDDDRGNTRMNAAIYTGKVGKDVTTYLPIYNPRMVKPEQQPDTFYFNPNLSFRSFPGGPYSEYYDVSVISETVFVVG